MKKIITITKEIEACEECGEELVIPFIVKGEDSKDRCIGCDKKRWLSKGEGK